MHVSNHTTKYNIYRTRELYKDYSFYFVEIFVILFIKSTSSYSEKSQMTVTVLKRQKILKYSNIMLYFLESIVFECTY